MLLDSGSGCASPLSIDGIAFGVGIWSTSRIATVQVGQTVLDRYKILESLLFEEMDPARAQVPAKTQVWDFFPEGDGLGGFPSDTEKR